VHNILTNPIYAGTYAFGRTTSKVSVENGRKRVRRGVRRSINECDVLIKDHHEGYISWDEFERNQRVIAHNAVSEGSAMVKGAVRKDEVLLAGLLRCGHCGRKLHVHYSSNIGRYTCYGARANHGTERCISIGSIKVDATVSTEVLRIVKPLGIDAAVKAIRPTLVRRQQPSDSTTWPYSKLATRQLTPDGSTMPLIHRTGWSPTSSSDAGTSRSKTCRGSSGRSRPARRCDRLRSMSSRNSN
jgi:hypothetical protein